jgi:hypothetical protein
MTTASHLILHILEHLVKVVPVGTNQALLQLMWAMVSGAFLRSRGAVHSGMQEAGFTDEEINRGWQALRYGVWRSEELLMRWRAWVAEETPWQPQVYEGWRPLAIDITTFWRPRLQGWRARFFHQVAQRLMPGVAFAIVVEVGHIARQRVPLLRKLIRGDREGETAAMLHARLLAWVRLHLAPKQVAVCDGGVQLQQMQAARVPRFLLRMAKNCTLRRNTLPPQEDNGGKGGRPREYGCLVRPLARTYSGRPIAASQPDVCGRFTVGDAQSGEAVTVRFHGWHGLVRPDQKVAAANETVSVRVFFDPRFHQPLVLATNIAASAQAIYQLYGDRWPVEQSPLAAKQMLGLHRHFVFAPASLWRLPELALLLGNVLTIAATLLPPMPSGYWDRHPKKRPAGYGARWEAPVFQTLTPLTAEFGKRRLTRPICRRELRPIAAFRGRFKPPDCLFQANFGPHC